ncbi:hypothetical protein [Endozoicomonas atrinae]|uniref:hypothetical protein n=1 Tax=Endozoicomonas atrinae TaxID=1333660 RepID=UPI003B00B524
MMEVLSRAMCEILSWNWHSFIQSATGLVTLILAYYALGSWKRQHKSQKVTELLDELTDSVHDFVQTIRVPVQCLQFIHIGIDSCQYDRELNTELKYPEAIRYIEKEGREAATELMASLKASESSVHRIRSLLVKGQIYNIENYEECMNACNHIVWQYDRLQVVYAVLRGQNMNWEHPKVIESVGNLLEITSDDINNYLKENQVAFLKFVKAAYSKEYSNA